MKKLTPQRTEAMPNERLQAASIANRLAGPVSFASLFNQLRICFFLALTGALEAGKFYFKKMTTGNPQPRKSLAFKLAALITLLTFATLQIAWAQGPVQSSGELQSDQAEKELTQTPSPDPEVPPVETSTQFLSDESPLSPVKEEEKQEEEKEEIKDEDAPSFGYETDRYFLEEALDLFRPEFASAVILKKPLSREDLKSLYDHSVKEGIEIAALVLHGETVLISSGNEDEITASPAAREILRKAAFSLHTHPDEHLKEGPSAADLEAAGSNTHYVLTRKQAYAYTEEGVKETGDIDWLVAKYLQALEASQTTKDEIRARKELNQLIAEQDRLNQLEEEAKETWVSGSTGLSYTSGLTASNVTTLPGSPSPYILAGSSAPTALSYTSSTNQFTLSYNVTASGSYSAMLISFDNASTSAVETRDLSGLSSMIFGVKGPSGKLHVDFIDVNGNKDRFTLKNIASSTERFWKILTSSIIAAVNKTKIKEIRLMVAQSTTSSSTRTGTEVIRIKGLNVNTPTEPAVTSSIPDATNQSIFTFTGTKEAHTAIVINGTEVIARNQDTTWSYTVNLNTEGNNTFDIQAKNTIQKLSTKKSVTIVKDTVVPTGSININSGGPYTGSRDVTLNLSGEDGTGSGVVKMSFSTDNTDWTSQEDYATSKSFTVPAGDGSKTIHVKYFDKAGNTAVFTDTIVLDTTAPGGSIKINDDASHAHSPDVTLTLTGSDATSGVDKMRFSSDGGTTWSDWEGFAQTKSFTLPSGNGTKEVQVEIRDKAGLVALFIDTILLETEIPVGYFQSLRFTDLTQGTATLELNFGSLAENPTQWSYSIDGGAFSTPEAYSSVKTITLPEAPGRRRIDVKLLDAAGNVLRTFREEMNLEALRALKDFNPDSAVKPIHDLIREGILRTDERGNLLALYNRDLLVDKASFTESSFLINPPTPGLTLPSITAEFEVGQGASALLLETGFVIPGEFIRGKEARGTVRLVIENGFFKLKVKRPVQEIVDSVAFLAQREEVIISKHTPQAGKRYEVQFDFTIDGLQVILDSGNRGIVTEPLFVLGGVQADPYFRVETGNVILRSVQMHGNTKKILSAANELHEFTYAHDAGGNLTEARDRVSFSRFASQDLKGIVYEAKRTFDSQGRLVSVTDRNGETVRFTYNTESRITSIEELRTGRITSMTYQEDANGNLTVTQTLQFTDGFSNSIQAVTKEIFSAEGRRTKLETPEGKVINFTHSATDPTVTAQVSEGSFTYSSSLKTDIHGRALRRVTRNGATETLTYTFRADGSEEVLIQRQTPDLDKTGASVIYETTERIVRDREGRILEREDSRGRISRFSYDAEGDITRFEDGLGRTTTWVYVKDIFGEVIRILQTLSYTDDFGNVINAVTAREFDRHGNLMAEVDPDGQARVHSYDFHSYNHLPKTRTTHFYKNIASIDALLTKHTSTPSSVTSKVEWDETGEVILEVASDSVERKRALTRDAKGNVRSLAVTRVYTAGEIPVSQTQTREFDLRGNVTKETDSLGNETRTTYSPFDELQSITRHLGKDTQNQFDRITTFSEKRNAAGILLSTEARENYVDGFVNLIETKVIREYDSFGNLTHEVGPTGDAQVIQYELRTDGRVSARTTTRYHSVTSLDDLKAKHSTSGSALKERIEYGLLGEVKRRVTFDEKTIVLVTERDPAGRVKKEEVQTSWLTQRDGMVTTTQTREFDLDGNLTRQVLANGDEILPTYGAQGSRLTSTQKVKFTGSDGIERIYEEKTTFGEIRSSAGLLTKATETVQSVDSFGNAFTNERVRTFNEFGEEIASIDKTGKGRITEYTRFPWDEVEEVRVYEYEGVDTLTALQDKHASSPKLIERSKVNFLGETIETENKDNLVTKYERIPRSNGLTQKETRRLQIPGETEKVFVDEFDDTGKLSRSTDDQGITATYTYALTGELLPQIETGQGGHSIETKPALLAYTHGVTKLASTATQGIDKFGRIVDLAQAQEFTTRGELAYEVTEDDRGKVLVYERDGRDRLIKLTTTELEDGRGFAGGGKLTIDLLKTWYGAPPPAFLPRVTTQEWDSLGNETTTETKEEWQRKLIYSNSLGRPRKIEKRIFHALGDKVPIVRTPIQTEAYPGAGLLPKIWVREMPVDLSALTGPGIAAVFWNGSGDINSITKVYAQTDLTSVITDLNSRQDGDYVILVTRGDLRTQLTESFFQALEAFGSEKVRSLAEGGAFAFVGVKGKGPGQAIEDYKRSDSAAVPGGGSAAVPGGGSAAVPAGGSEIAKASNFRHTLENYDTHGYLTHYEDGFGSVFDYTRGFDGEALKMVGTKGGGRVVITTTYKKIKDSKGRLLSTEESVTEKITKPDGSTETKTYDKGRAFGASEILTSRKDAQGVITTFNQEGDIVKVEDLANGIVKTYEIEKYATGTLKRKKEIVSVTAKNVEGVLTTTTVVTESHYDTLGKLTRFIDTKGEETTYAYTASGETKTVRLPDGERIEYSYTSDTPTGSRTTTETHYKGSGKESEVVKIHNKEGDLIFLSEHLQAESLREEITYTYEYWPGVERKLKRKDATHRFINVTTGAEALKYSTFEERSVEGLILKSRDRDGVEKSYEYREKRVWEIRETRAGDTTMHYYFYRKTDSHPGFQYPVPDYSDLDQDEGVEDGSDLDFVLLVRDRGTPDKSDDEIQLVQYSGEAESERIEKKILYHLGGTANPDKESGYVYHFDGSLDQIHDSRYEYLYNPATSQMEKGPKRLESTTTYKTDSLTGEPRIDKITDAFTIKNHFYTSTGRLERVEETNGAFPARVTKSYYNPFGDIIRIEDFYGRNTYFEYVKSEAGRNLAAFETNDRNPDERTLRIFNEEGETTTEMDTNGRLTLFEPKPHSTRLGKIVTETRYFLSAGGGSASGGEDSSLWLSPWYHNVPGTYQQILQTFDLNKNGKIEDQEVESLFNQSSFPSGTRLHRDKTQRLLNREGDIILSLSPEGELSVYDYAKDIFEAKKQTQWNFYTQDTLTGYKRIDLDGFDPASSSAWTTLTEKLLRAGARDYGEAVPAGGEELTPEERTRADQDRQSAIAEFLVGIGKISNASDLTLSKTTRRHNSNGELIEETEATGLARKSVYQRDTFGVPKVSFTTNSRDSALIKQEFNTDGDVIRQELTNGLTKEFTYEKDTKGNVKKIIERTLYPHNLQGTGSIEIRELNLQGEIIRITDKNGVVTDITTRENAKGEKEIERKVKYQDSFGHPIEFAEIERLNRYGHTVYRKDKSGRIAQTSPRYNSLGRVQEATEATDFVMESGQAIHYEEFYRFNNEGEQIFVRDKNGREIEFEYVKDAYGNTAEVRETELLKTGVRALTVRKLSPTGETIAQTDKNGFTQAYAYDKDALGNVKAAYEISKLRYDFSGDRQADDRDLQILIASYGKTDSGSLKLFDLTGDGVINEEDAKLLTQSKEYGTREVATTRAFSPFGDILSVTDKNGRKMIYEYEKDLLGNIKRSMEANTQFQGKIFRLFNKDGSLIQMKDQNGNAIRYLYTLDSKGNILETKEEQELAPKAPVAIKETFDAHGRRVLWEQGDRKITTTYNPDGSFKEVETDTKGLIRETDFDTQGRKTKEWQRKELGQNLARGAQIKTSESLDPAQPPSRMVDGIHDRNRGWYSKNSQVDGLLDKEFVELDLGSVQTLAEVWVDNGAQSDSYFVRRFDVSISQDGITWKRVGGQAGLNHQGIMTVSFPEEEARFVKIHNFQSLNGAGDSYYVFLNEIEVFGYRTEGRTENLALQKSVRASSFGGGGEPWRSLDGDFTTNWYAQTANSDTTPEWLTLDLGKEVKANEILIDQSAGGDHLKEFRIRVNSFDLPTDDPSWREITFEKNATTNQIYRYTFQEASFRYVLVDKMAGPGYRSIAELQVYGLQGGRANYAYTSDAQGNTITRVTDSFGLVREEKKDSQGRVIYRKERKGKTENLAAGKPAQAGTSYNGSYTADKALDQNSTTNWLSSWGDTTNFYRADLGSVKQLSEITLNTSYPGNTNYALDSFRLEVTQDDPASTSAVWKEIVYQTGAWPKTNWTFHFAEQNVRGVRLKDMTAKTGDGNPYPYVFLAELEAYGFSFNETWTSYETDGQGNTTTALTDVLGLLRQEKKDSQGRVIYVKERKGSSYDEKWTSYTADAQQNLVITVTDAFGLVREETRDSQGRIILLRLNGASPVEETYEYSTDPFGNLITTIRDNLGNVRVSEEIRDAEGRLIRIDWHYQKKGKDYIVIVGDRTDKDFSQEDLTSPLPIIRASNTAPSVTASGEFAERAIDGKFGAYTSARIGGWLLLELEHPAVIGRMDTYLDRTSANGVRYQIEASLDGVNWHSVVEKTQGYYSGLQQDSFLSVKAQFVRIRATASQNGASDFRLEEIRIVPPKGWPVSSAVTRTFNLQGDLLKEFQQGGRAESFTYEKDALENVTRATQTHHKTDRLVPVSKVKDNLGNTISNNLIDGNRDTAERSYIYQPDNAYYEFELKEPTEISEVRMLFSDSVTHALYSYWIDVSEDGINWTRVFDHPEIDARSWQRAVFNPVKARFIRVGGKCNDTGNGLYWNEVEIYGTPTSVVDYVTSRYVDQEFLAGDQVHAVTAFGDAQITPSQSKFGGASGFFDGTGDSLSTADSPDWDFGTGDFTLDLWVRFNSIAGDQAFIDRGEGNNFIIQKTSSGNLQVGLQGNGELIIATWGPSINTWYHIAVTRSGTDVKAFVDGTQVGSTATSSADMQGTAAVRIGQHSSGGRYVNGWLDEVRISKGAARYTANFTPPAAELANDASTKLLLHMNGPDRSTRFEDSPLITKALPKEGKVTAAIDRDGKLTRTTYEYDPSGNQIGTFQMTEKYFGGTLVTEFSGEVRDSQGRVTKQIADNGQVTYFSYDLDEFGNIRKAFVRDTEPETVSVRQNLLQPASNIGISGPEWADIDLKSDKKNYLFDGNLATVGYVYIPAGTERPLTFDFKKKVDLSRVRFFTQERANFNYRIEVSSDGNSWTEVARNEKGGIKREWYDHDFTANGIQKLRIVPSGVNEYFFIYEIQIYEAPSEEKNFQTVREYDFRGNITNESNVLYEIWQSRPELKVYFPDPGKKGVIGRWKDKTIADWAKEEGWLEDPRLHAYRPQEEWITQELKDAFDSRRDLQRRFTDESGLVNWASTTGYLTDSRLDAYRPGRVQDNTLPSGLLGNPPAGTREDIHLGSAVEEWRPIGFDLAGTSDPNLIDGNEDTGQNLGWQEGQAPPYFSVKLNEKSQVGRIRLKTPGASSSGYAFTIEGSTDGTNWFTVVDRTQGLTDIIADETFPAVDIQTLRITGHYDAGWGRTLSINEVEVYAPIANPIPYSIERFDAAGNPTTNDNALFLVWKSNALLQKIFPLLSGASAASGRWSGKTLLQWAQEEGYKHYANLASYAPLGTSYILPGLRQVLDDTRALQDRFRKTGNKDSDLIQYARNRGYREDSRLFYYAPYGPSEEVARKHTFETRFDLAGNASILMAKDENGRRTERRFNQEGRLVGEKPELILLWEERPELFKAYTDSSSLHSWATSTGYKDPLLSPILSDYSPYALGGQDTGLPYLMESGEVYDPLGFVKETKETLWNLSGGQVRTNQTFYNALGHETRTLNEQGDFSYTLYLDRDGRLIRKSDQYGNVDWIPVDVATKNLGNEEIQSQIIRNFILAHGRLPSAEELSREAGFIQEKGRYASRTRLTLTKNENFSSTTVGGMDPTQVKSYGGTSAELSEITRRAEALKGGESGTRQEEEKLETKHLETLTQRIFRKLLGRDPKEEGAAEQSPQGTPTELEQMTGKLRSLNSVFSFERFIKEEYNIDASGKTEHKRRTEELKASIDSIYNSLALFFGFPSQITSLGARLEALLKLLKSDPAFELKELTLAQLEKIKARLLELIGEDIHFGQSAVYALRDVLNRNCERVHQANPEEIATCKNALPSLKELTGLALFFDILTSVVSSEFIGNLQFSAYTLKVMAEVMGLKLTGLKIHWEELKALLQAGYPVIANIEERHFVVVTGMGPDTVTFVENGIIRTKPATEFQARWFGTVLVDDKVLTDPNLSHFSLNTKVLSTQELLKVKGAGFFKKLFRKIAKFFQRVINTVVKVLRKAAQALQKFLNTGFGKVVGFILGGPLVLAALNFAINSFSYLGQGDIKGLFKYWGQNALQIAMIAIMFIPGVGQALYAGLQFLFQAFFAAVQFVVGATLQFLGSALSAGLGSVLGSFAAGLGGFARGAGSFLSQAGSRLMSQAQHSLKELFSGLKGSFSRVSESLKRSLGGYRPNAQPLPPHAGIEFSPRALERIPTHPWIQNHGLDSLAQETSKIVQKSLLERVTDFVNKFSLSLIQQKIDQKLEKSKMNSFVKFLLSSFTSASLGAVTGALLSSAAQSVPSLIQSLGRGISSAFDATKSFFSNLGQRIFGTRNAPVNASELTRLPGGSIRVGTLGSGGGSITIPEGALGGNFAYASDGIGTPTELLQGNSRFILNPVSDNILRGDLDTGDLVSVKPNFATAGAFQIEQIGNLAQDLFTKGPAGAGERIAEIPEVQSLGWKVVAIIPSGKAVVQVPVRVGIGGVKVSVELGFRSPATLIRSAIAGPFGGLPSLEKVNYSVFGFRGKIPDQPLPKFDPFYFFTPGPLPQSRFVRDKGSSRWWELYEDN